MSYKTDQNKPPKWPLILLRWFCSDQWLEEIEGDLMEDFVLNCRWYGKQKAKRIYAWTVIRSFRGYLYMDKLTNQHYYNKSVMFSNYLKITLRTLRKNKVYSFINVSGLAIGIAGALLILHYVNFETSYDTYQKDADDIYRVSLDIYQNGEQVFHSAENYPAVGPDMQTEFPEVTDWAHLYNMGSKNNVVITYEEGQGQPIQFKHRKFLYASPSVLSFFGVPMVDGDPETALNDPFTMVISESTAKKYFGDENPIGKRLRLKDDDFNDENCLVTGVFKDLAPNTHLKFDVLISTETLYGRFDGAITRYKTGWQRKDFYTYVKLVDGANTETLTAKFPPFVDKHMPELKERGGRNDLHLQPLKDIHLTSTLADEAELNGNSEPITFLSIIAIFIVVIAWVNYINLATSRSLDRAKEVGIRKVLGSQRAQLIRQFMFESVAINFMAAVLALLIVLIAVPSFHATSGIPNEVSIWSNTTIWITLVGIFFFGSFVSGFYPAVVLSSFKPVSTLKGKFRNSGSGVILRKVLVVFQFAASAALIIGTFTVYRQMQYLKTADLGFNPENTIVVERAAIASPDRQGRAAQVNSFRDELMNNASIVSVSGTGMVPGKKIRFKADTRGFTQPAGETYPLNGVGGDHRLIETMGMELVAGKGYEFGDPTNDTTLMVTENAVRLLGFDSPEDIINKKIVIENFRFTGQVRAVVKDYNHESLRIKAIPSIFFYSPFGVEYYMIKVNKGAEQQALQAIEQQWNTVFPGNPFEYFFLEEYFNEQYKSEEQFQSLFSVFAVLAIFIGCLGLFGLSAFTAMKRTKEIGIRKVLGATVPGLFYQLSKEFIILILVSNIIAWPLIYFTMDSWLQGFEYRTSINLLVFGLATLMVLTIALITVSFQTIRSARLNPVESLRYE